MPIFILILFLLLGGVSTCTYDGIEDIKSNASKVFEDNGFKVIGYEGYVIGNKIPFTNYGSAKVWFILSDGKTKYQAMVQRFNDEYHIYNLQALDALKGN